MDNRETLTPSSGDAILKRHLFSEVARNWIKGRGHIERAYFVRRPSRQSFGFRVAASSGPIPKAPGSAGGYLQRSEYNSGGRSHRTAWTDSRSPQLEVRGHEYHRSDRQLSVRWEPLCPIETNCCADQGHSSWACRSRQPSSRCGSVRVSARTPPPTKMPGQRAPSNASKLRLHFQPLRRHRLWQLLVRYLALGKTGNREQLSRSNGCRPRDSSLSNLGATATCFDYTNV